MLHRLRLVAGFAFAFAVVAGTVPLASSSAALIVGPDGQIPTLAPVQSSSDLRNRVGLTPVGRTIRLTILRNGSRQTVDVKIESAG